MYFDSFSITVRVALDGWLGTEHAQIAREYSLIVPEEGFNLSVDDELLGEIQRFVFERTGMSMPYLVEFRHRSIEQGSSSSLGEIIIELLDSSGDGAWQVLATLVSTMLLDRVRRDNGGP